MNQLVYFLEGILAHGVSGTLTDIHHESFHSENMRAFLSTDVAGIIK
ncbi:hypothetical protein ACTFP3_27560 [Bacillus cereus group sp. MYBK5-2]